MHIHFSHKCWFQILIYSLNKEITQKYIINHPMYKCFFWISRQCLCFFFAFDFFVFLSRDNNTSKLTPVNVQWYTCVRIEDLWHKQLTCIKSYNDGETKIRIVMPHTGILWAPTFAIYIFQNLVQWPCQTWQVYLQLDDLDKLVDKKSDQPNKLNSYSYWLGN